MQKQTMEWNTQKKIWQRLKENHLLELWEPFLETWPISGMTVNGQVYELPMQARHINGSESLSSPIPENSLLRTPSVTDSSGGARSEKQASERGQMVKTADQIVQLAFENGLKVSPAVAKSLLPTPTVFHLTMHDEPLDTFLAREERSSTGQIGKSTGVALPMEQGKSFSSWGKFEPAIRRWESIIGRPAPVPTKPDGKDGAHRLSSAFTEWMMGVPEGWITDAEITRKDELKACGNGVVP